jgi:hypothetical protein
VTVTVVVVLLHLATWLCSAARCIFMLDSY